MHIHFVVLVLNLPEVLKVDSCLVKHLLALGVNEYDLLVLLQLLPCLKVFIGICKLDRFDLALGFLDLHKEFLLLFFQGQLIELPVEERLGLLWKSRIGVSSRSEF